MGRPLKYGDRALTATERKRRERKQRVRFTWADQINEIVARLSREDADRFLESRILPHYFLAELNELLELHHDVWEIISGEPEITEPWQWRAVQACLADAARLYDRPHKPTKSSSHDAPWRRMICALDSCKGNQSHDAHRVSYLDHGDLFEERSIGTPLRWAPRRWFGPCPSGPPLQISTARTVGMRAQLEAEFSAEVASSEGRFSEALTAEASLPRRNHPHPGGFWGPAKGYWGPQTAPYRQRVIYIREIDEQPPESVLAQTHEPPAFPEDPPPIWRGRLRAADAKKGYWPSRPWNTPQLEEVPRPPPPLLRIGPWKPEEKTEWWKTKLKPGYRYWDQHVLAVCEGVQWPTKPQRRAGASYTIDLIWEPVEFGPRSAGVHFAMLPFWPANDDAPIEKRRTLKRERLQSPYIPRGFEPLWRPNKDAKGWAASGPDKRPGAWAREHVEKPANTLSEKRRECRRRHDAAIDGLLSNFGCDDFVIPAAEAA